ncbi:adenylate/guanylate cyclase domain-containing protein, partial [bacterium]
MNKNVMFTDIVGYSKLTGADQNLALELLKEHDKIIEPIIKQYKGKIVKRIGDAIVAIFNHSKEVIQASVEIQQALKNRNNRNTKNRHIIIRIGLHYGEIIIKKDEIYGLGYELASSIEPICEFGGIAISEDLYQQSHEKNELIIHGDGSHFFIRPIANFSFKSITNKLKIYKLYLNFLDWYDESQSQVHSYLKEQNIKSNQYDFKNISSNYNTNIQHYDKAFSFYKNNNFSYALYHYKMYLDSNIENQKDTSLYILYIYACLGLDRLVDRICKTLSDNFISELNLIKGIKNFNQSNFTESQIYLEKYINAKKINFLNDATSYLLIIYFQNKDYQKGLDLIKFNS